MILKKNLINLSESIPEIKYVPQISLEMTQTEYRKNCS